MRGRTGRGTTTGAAVLALLALAAPAAAQTADERPGLRDTLYVFPLGAPTATPECLLVLCPLVQPFAPVGTGPDAGTTGLRVTGLPVVPPRVVAESRSEPLPFDGADPQGTTAVRLSAATTASGSGGTVRTSVRVVEAEGGRTVAELPPVAAPLDGTRRTAGPLELPPSRLTLGRTYVAVARFEFDVPGGGSVTARVHAPRLLAVGPRRVRSTTPLRAARPVVRLRGRELQVTARCPSGRARCEVRTRSTAAGLTIGTGRHEMQAASRHTFRVRLTAAQLRLARRARAIVTTVRVEDENGRVGSARRTLRLAAR